MKRINLVILAAALSFVTAAPLLAQQKTMTSSTGIALVWIPPGEFMMGSTTKEKAWADYQGCNHTCSNPEGEPRPVKVPHGFWLGRTELTVRQWQKFVDFTRYITDAERAKKIRNWREPRQDVRPKDHHAVCWISWNDAVAYCDWLTKTERKARKLPPDMEYRLPTEAEWEYACRAGQEQTKFWWGDNPADGARRLNWYGAEDGQEYEALVDSFGTRGRNKFGLADMLGNVWEWCLDDYDRKGGHAGCYKGNPGACVRKGGAWSQFNGFERCATRTSSSPISAANHFGFRVCCGVRPTIEK
ncbi:MAG: SUMF1/EgtB/PvdO family nonheme iron enzyme [Verrucomicrobia bacterium]|nr:SUMF1/EgtB/PvdO family nonheme iron enzyme [Verrucomicrobiota bacterium]